MLWRSPRPSTKATAAGVKVEAAARSMSASVSDDHFGRDARTVPFLLVGVKSFFRRGLQDDQGGETPKLSLQSRDVPDQFCNRAAGSRPALHTVTRARLTCGRSRRT